MKKFSHNYSLMLLLLLCLSFTFSPVYAGNNDIENLVKDSYIVVFKEKGFSSPGLKNKHGESVSQAAKRLVAEVRANQIAIDRRNGNSKPQDGINKLSFVYEHSLKGFSAKLSPQAVEALSKNPLIEAIEKDGIASINATQNNPSWGLDRIDQHDLPLNWTYQYDKNGSNVHVYVLDTGIELTHSEFTGRIGNGYDFIDNDSNASDCRGHGTHVAGTIAGTTVGVAKNATVHPVRVLNCSGSGTWSQIIAGINWVQGNAVRPAVANMSLGGGGYFWVDWALSNAVNSGITFVVSAGNDSANACNKSPARAASAITVASSTLGDGLSSFSNFGSCVDVIAPGSSIRSSDLNNRYSYKSGTSMASPHVAGVAAQYLEMNPAAKPSYVTSMITHNASQGKISNPGSGTPNSLLYSKITDPMLPPIIVTNNISWNGGHGIADRWGFADVFGNNRDIYVTHRNNGQLYATQLNRNGTLQNWSWNGGHGIANRWAFSNIFGNGKDIYVTHRNDGQFYATQLNSNGTLQNWHWRGGHGVADRFFFANVFGTGKDIYVTHRNNGQFYATQLNSNGTLKNWSWNGGHGVADRWFAADIFGNGSDVYVTHRNSQIAYATQINSDGTLKNWTWTGVHGYANRWFVADIFGEGRKLYVTHRNNGQFYATQFNEDGTVTNWSWNGGHGVADRAAFVDYFGTGQYVYVTHRNSGEIYITKLNKDGTLVNWTGNSHGVANRATFANIFGDGKQEYVTHRNNGQVYATEPKQ